MLQLWDVALRLDSKVEPKEYTASDEDAEINTLENVVRDFCR